MRYPKEHKAETHARIVRNASVRLREKGVHGVGVADLMKEAGLTHGGFYAHFSSRDALLVEAVAHAMDRSIARWRKNAETTPPDERMAAIVNAYLAPSHRDDPGYGCAIAARGAEIAREGAKTRRVFGAKIEEMGEVLTEQVGTAPDEAARREAIATLALMTGALVLARAAGNAAFSGEILDVARDRALADTTAAPKPAPRKRAAKEPAAKKPQRKAKS
jgi:TetR/AcrR family transcriptional repressor of nem operon